MKKATHKESRSLQNLWGLKSRQTLAPASAPARHSRKQPPRGFGARNTAHAKDSGVLSKVLRALKLKK